MSTYDRPVRDRQVGDERYGVASVVDDRRVTTTSDPVNSILRALGAIAGGVAVVIGIVALIRVNWDAGFDAFPVGVAGMAFTPAVAIATLVVGLIAVAAAVSPAREPKLAVGGILTCVGLGILIAGSSRSKLDLVARHGWFALAIGVVLLLTGLLMRDRLETRRVVHAERI